MASKFKCIWANDNEPKVCKIYWERFYDDKLHWGDIRAIKDGDIPDHDLLCAGFPCQSFSIAGKRRGFEDTRGTLFFEVCRVLRVKRPSYLLLENVKGLLSHDNGRTFSIILSSLDELGYDCQWQVLNAKMWLPQNRERIFIVGHLREKPFPKVFPIRESGKRSNSSPEETQGALQVGSSELENNPIYVVQLAHQHQNRWGEWIKKQEYTDTLDSWGTLGIMQLSNGKMSIRALTPLECERLQGFPDNWTEGLSDQWRYTCLGNAVPPIMIQKIGEILARQIELKEIRFLDMFCGIGGFRKGLENVRM